MESLSIRETADAGHYPEALHPEALRLAEARAAKKEALETKREGQPGKDTARALRDLAGCALLARDFTKELSAANRAHALLPDDLGIESNRAHALMFSGREEEAEALYLAPRGERLSKEDSRIWESVIAEDFAELRKAGLTHPMMAEIEQRLGVSP